MNLEEFIKLSFEEDLGNDCDHTSVACITEGSVGSASLLARENCIIAGIELAKNLYSLIDESISFGNFKTDGDPVEKGEVIFQIKGDARNILKSERIILNCMQRMSGIATTTSKFVNLVSGYPVRILDTRKTSPLIRDFEKWAVRIGGGHNHRKGLFDMILIKDNHIDFCGSVTQALKSVQDYLKSESLNIPVEIEIRSFNELEEAMSFDNRIDRIMFDNFSTNNLSEAVKVVDKKFETEASGGINETNVVEYASTGVDFISIGSLTHSYKCTDLSLVASI